MIYFIDETDEGPAVCTSGDATKAHELNMQIDDLGLANYGRWFTKEEITTWPRHLQRRFLHE